jgi:hypothetical protein
LAAVDSSGTFVGILFEKHPGQLWPRLNFVATSADLGI